MGLPGLDDLEGLVVVVAAVVADGHGVLLAGRVPVDADTMVPPSAAVA